jgi:hypothetical protein
MGYVHTNHSSEGCALQIASGHGNPLEATVVQAPLYKEATGRKKLTDFL